MTDGTSQGLFIVVAIVIFGIFTVLAYTLFEDTLSPALANMFSDATEKTQKQLTKGELPFTSWDFRHYLSVHKVPGSKSNILEREENSITFSSDAGIIHGGIYIPVEYFDYTGTYRVSYDLTLLEGEVYRLGGHLRGTDTQVFKVNGERVGDDTSYHYGEDYNLEVGKTYHIELTFKRNATPDLDSLWLHIQPNRDSRAYETNDTYLTGYKVRVDNAKLYKLN